MPSPDIREFVDLTLYDLESQSIYLRALDYARIAMPEFRPVEGSIETVLMQAVAVEVAELVTSINRLPGGVLQALLKLYEVERLDGTSPTAVVRIVGVNSSVQEIPAGTRFFYLPSSENEPLVLETNSSVSLTVKKTMSVMTLNETDPSIATVTTAVPHGMSVGEVAQFLYYADDGPVFGSTYTVGQVTSLYSFVINGFIDVLPPSGTPWESIYLRNESQPLATGYVTATGTTITNAFNGIVAGTELDLLSVVQQVSSASLATTVSGGRQTETDSEYFSRASANLARANLALVTADSFTQWVLTASGFTEVYRATTLDSTGFDRATSAGGVLIIVAPVDAGADNTIGGVGSGAIDPSQEEWGEKDEIQAAATELSHPNLNVYVSDPVMPYVKVDVSVSPADGKTGVEASNAVKTVLEGIISPNSWDWSTTLRKNDIIAAVYNAENSEGERVVGYVQSVSISITDIHIPSGAYGVTSINVANYSLVGGTGEVTTDALHGLDANNTNYVALYTPLSYPNPAGWYAFKVLAVTDDLNFVVEIPEGMDDNGGYTQWYSIGWTTPTTTSNGDLVISDPAPLLISGDHEVTIV